jgi:hypothetical protein
MSANESEPRNRSLLPYSSKLASMSTPLIQVHDAFFKQVMSDSRLAGTFLREHLPADVVDLLGPEPGGALRRLVPHQAEQIMGYITQPFYDQGKAEGEANILTRFLERRFGTVPDSLRQRIFAADVGSIETWVERAFDAPDLQSIFDPSSPR